MPIDAANSSVPQLVRRLGCAGLGGVRAGFVRRRGGRGRPFARRLQPPHLFAHGNERGHRHFPSPLRRVLAIAHDVPIPARRSNRASTWQAAGRAAASWPQKCWRAVSGMAPSPPGS